MRKNKGDFFYYLEEKPESNTLTFKKSKRVMRVNSDGSVSKTKKALFKKHFENNEESLTQFKERISEHDFNILMEMLKLSYK